MQRLPAFVIILLTLSPLIACSVPTPFQSENLTPPPTFTTLPDGSVTIDSISHKLVKAVEDPLGNKWCWFDVEASGTAAGPVSSYLSIAPYHLSGSKLITISGWKQIDDQTWQRTSPDPESVKWTLVSTNIELTKEGESSTLLNHEGTIEDMFNGSANYFEVRVTLYVNDQSGQSVVVDKAVRPYTIPPP